MFNEKTNTMCKDIDNITLALTSGDIHSVRMIGEITDRIFKNGVFVEERKGHNLVVNSVLKLIMCLLKNQSGYSGIQYWAVGSGASSWDSSMPSPDVNATRLTAEIGRVAIPSSEIVFLDSNNNVSSTPTNIIQITHTFGTADCNGVWREFGIFGGNATATANSGLMINKRHHAVITKTSEMTVERVMRFTLSLA
jgi:hypothetical protein